MKLESGQSLDSDNIRVYQSGQNTIAICPQQASVANSLEVHNSGSGNVVIERIGAAQNNVELSGTGPISITANPPPRATGHVSLSGSSSITVRTHLRRHPLPPPCLPARRALGLTFCSPLSQHQSVSL